MTTQRHGTLGAMRIPVDPVPSDQGELRDTVIQLGQEIEALAREMGDAPTPDQAAWFDGLSAEHSRLSLIYRERDDRIREQAYGRLHR